MKTNVFKILTMILLSVFLSSFALAHDNDAIENQMEDLSSQLEEAATHIYQRKSVGNDTIQLLDACIKNIEAVKNMTPKSIENIGDTNIKQRALQGYQRSLAALQSELEALKVATNKMDLAKIKEIFARIDTLSERGHDQFKGRKYSE